jgi:hypothetical protein
MALPAVFLNSPQAEIDKWSIKQILALCGDGKLLDGESKAAKLREYFRDKAEVENLLKYLQTCLRDKTFEDREYVLQDLVNEFGHRLEYDVQNGLYHGKKLAGEIGFDGLWYDKKNKHHFVVEVKTSNVFYRDPDIQFGYLEDLRKSGKITGGASVMFVVGDPNTKGLENQLVGAQHAYEARIISAKSLANLALLKKNVGLDLIPKIHALFIPSDLLKLDRTLEIAFSVAEDAKSGPDESVEPPESPEGSQQPPRKGTHQIAPAEKVAELRGRVKDALARLHGPLIQRSIALYWSSNEVVRAVLTISSKLRKGNYLFGYRLDWDRFLRDGRPGLYVLGCIDRSEAYVIPYKWIHSRTNKLSEAKPSEGKPHWMVVLHPTPSRGLALRLKNGEEESLEAFKMPLPKASTARA